jgi:hypothetical protein
VEDHVLEIVGLDLGLGLIMGDFGGLVDPAKEECPS